MLEIGSYVVYKRDVCKIVNTEIKEGIKYYELVPIDDNSLKIKVPIDNESLKELMPKEEVMNLIKKIPNIDIIDCNDKTIEHEYKALLSTGNKEDLVKIIKTTYLKNKERLDNKKKISDKDNSYFEKAERILYNEISIVLEKSFEETKKYFIERVTEIIK